MPTSIKRTGLERRGGRNGTGSRRKWVIAREFEVVGRRSGVAHLKTEIKLPVPVIDQRPDLREKHQVELEDENSKGGGERSGG